MEWNLSVLFGFVMVEEAMVVGWGRWWERREKEEEGNGGGAIKDKRKRK